jgi:tight adherence protein C
MNAFLHSPDLLSVFCGLAAFAVVLLVWNGLFEHDPLPERLKSIAERREEIEGEQRKKNTRRANLQRVGLMKRVVEWLKLTQGKNLEELRLSLKRAGYHSRDAMFVYLFARLACLLLFAIGGFCFLMFVPIPKIAALTPPLRLAITGVLAMLGWALPATLLKNKWQQRETILRLGLPDALDLMVICAEAGLGLDSAFDRVGREIAPSTPELAEEIGLTAVELNFLPDRSKALRGLSERAPLPGVIALVNTLIQTEKYGTPLAQALRVLSAEMREDRMMRAEEKAARLPATLTVPMILFILPPLFVVLIGPAVIKVGMALAGQHH